MTYRPPTVGGAEGSQQNPRLVVGGEGEEELRLLAERLRSDLNEATSQQRHAPHSLEVRGGATAATDVTSCVSDCFLTVCVP